MMYPNSVGSFSLSFYGDNHDGFTFKFLKRYDYRDFLTIDIRPPNCVAPLFVRLIEGRFIKNFSIFKAMANVKEIDIALIAHLIHMIRGPIGAVLD